MGIIRQHKLHLSKSKPKYNIMVETYGSAMEMVNDCRKRPITDSSFDNMKTRVKGDKDWYGVESYDEALEYLHNGYQPSVEKLREKMNARVVGESKRMSFKNNIVGYSPVVPLALKGVPNCMVDMQMKPIKAKVIDIYYDMTASCGHSAKEFLDAGQKLLGAIIALEKQGYRFNLYAVQSYSSSGNADMVVVKVKTSSQPLDLKRISFPITHPAFFRVVGFDWYSKTPKGTYRSGYGRALSYELNEKERRELADSLFGKSSVFLNCTEIMKEGEDHIKEMLLVETNNKK